MVPPTVNTLDRSDPNPVISPDSQGLRDPAASGLVAAMREAVWGPVGGQTRGWTTNWKTWYPALQGQEKRAFREN